MSKEETTLHTVVVSATVDGTTMGQIVKSHVPENCIEDAVISLTERFKTMVLDASDTTEMSSKDVQGATGVQEQPKETVIKSPNSIESKLTLAEKGI